MAETASPRGVADEFYVGYFGRAPVAISRFVRRSVVVIFVLALLTAAAGAGLEHFPGTAVWAEKPVTRSGVFLALPYPMLLVNSRGERPHAVLLVNQGKCGLLERGGFCGPRVEDPAALLAKFDGLLTEVRGTALSRDGRDMIELEAGLASMRSAVGENWRDFPTSELKPVRGERVTLRGMIVDSKCYLGAMKPGEGKTHRSCAVRCIEGGVPPVLVVAAESGPEYYVLEDSRGGACGALVLPFVADEVEVVGEVGRVGDLKTVAVESIAQR